MKRMLYIALVLLMCLSMMLTASAYTSGQQKTADALHELELFLGTDKGYELDNKLTRAQGVTLLIRMMGKETEATMNVLKTPFEDVPAWAEGYIGYAYAHGITKGVSAINFGSDAELSDYMFLTLVLRALGYSDSGESARFVWNNPYALATEVGLIDQNAADSNLTRGDTVEILWNAMSVKLNRGSLLPKTIPKLLRSKRTVCPRSLHNWIRTRTTRMKQKIISPPRPPIHRPHLPSPVLRQRLLSLRNPSNPSSLSSPPSRLSPTSLPAPMMKMPAKKTSFNLCCSIIKLLV